MNRFIYLGSPRAAAEARGGVTAHESNAAARVERRSADDDFAENGAPRRLGDVLGGLLVEIEPDESTCGRKAAMRR